MANLHRRDDREAWLRWAVEFLRRGLDPADVITVHGPHQPPANYLWGEAEAWDGESGLTVAFQSAPVRPGQPTRRSLAGLGVRFWDRDSPARRFAVLRADELPLDLRRKLGGAARSLTRTEPMSRPSGTAIGTTDQQG
jgi:hypothetical protein